MPGFVRFLEEAVQAHPLQLMLCAAQEPPGSEQLQKTIHICMFLEQRPVEPTGFQYGIVGTDFPSHPLCLLSTCPEIGAFSPLNTFWYAPVTTPFLSIEI